MRNAVTGIGTILAIFFTFISMSTLVRSVLMYQEAAYACNQAVYVTCLMLAEEDGAIESNAELKSVFRTYASEHLGHSDNYRITIYGADYRSGLISAGISYSWIPWINANDKSSPHYKEAKTIEVRRVMTTDEIA